MRLGTPLRFALVMAALYLPTGYGKADLHDATLSDILNREPISFDEFANEERSCGIR